MKLDKVKEALAWAHNAQYAFSMSAIQELADHLGQTVEYKLLDAAGHEHVVWKGVCAAKPDWMKEAEVMVIVPFSWGRGPTLKDAELSCKSNAGSEYANYKKQGNVKAYLVPKGAWLDDMGANIYWENDPKEEGFTVEIPLQ